MNPGRSSDEVVEARRRRLYRRQLDGLSARALVYDHAEKEQVSVQPLGVTGKLLKNGTKKIGKLIAKICSRACSTCVPNSFIKLSKKGQLQTASQVLDSIGRVIGESVETVNIQAPELKISIENKDD